MKLSSLGEFGLIRKIQNQVPRKVPGIVIGIGDDAAGLSVSPQALLLATTDMLIEDVHFNLSYTDFYSLGWKSAAVNISDIAAMGGVPRFCLTSLGIPPRISVEQISEFYRGFNALLSLHQTALAGGDTCSSRSGFIISVTALGEALRKKAVTRAGAKAGDLIFVTNTLGDSAAGLELLRNAECGMRNRKSEIPAVVGAGREPNPKSAIAKLAERHLRPIPRVEWGRAIALSGCASAMIDVSDGLSSDLAHICEQSSVGALLRADALPFSPALRKAGPVLKLPLLQYALSGGEDYELLFTVPRRKRKALSLLGIPATEIGEVISGRGLSLIDGGVRRKLKPTGYNHFIGSNL